MARMIGVLVVDDHALYRSGLRAFLELDQDIEVVGEVGDGAAALGLVDQVSPDVVLLDVRMPGMSGPEVCEQITARHPEVKVLMLTSSDEDADLFASIRAGAAGYVLKDAPPDDLGDAVRAVSTGHSLIPPTMAATLLQEFATLSRGRSSREVPHDELTEREHEVLRLVARGLKNREIATDLFIAENTVKNHVRSILDKLRLHSRVEAAMYAVRSGLVDPDDADV